MWISFASFVCAPIFVLLNTVPTEAVLGAAILFPWLSAWFLPYPKTKNAKVLRHGANTRVSVPRKLALTIFV